MQPKIVKQVFEWHFETCCLTGYYYQKLLDWSKLKGVNFHLKSNIKFAYVFKMLLMCVFGPRGVNFGSSGPRITLSLTSLPWAHWSDVWVFAVGQGVKRKITVHYSLMRSVECVGVKGVASPCHRLYMNSTGCCMFELSEKLNQPPYVK